MSNQEVADNFTASYPDCVVWLHLIPIRNISAVAL